jgi:hypothetical protein
MTTTQAVDVFGRWISLIGPLRAEFLEPLHHSLTEPIPAPSDAAEIVAPVIELVERAPLWSYQGRIDERIARDMARRYGWEDHLREEDGLLEVDILTMHLVVAELFVKKSRIRPTREFKKLISDPVAVWETVADTFLTRYYVWGSQPELTLAHLVRKRHDPGVFDQYWRAAVEAFVVEDGVEDPDTLFEKFQFCNTMTGQVLRALRMLDLTVPEDETVELTDGGYVTALRALRAAMSSNDRAVWAYQERGIVTPN